MKKFTITFDSLENPPFIWVNALASDEIAGRAKLLKISGGVEIKLLTVAPCCRLQGVASLIVEKLKGKYKTIKAPDVKYDARLFWKKMNFVRVGDSDDYIWENDC